MIERDRIGVRADALGKRLFDVIASALLLIVVAPLFVALAIAVKLESRGPVFFGSRRVGRSGRDVRVLKFRKMRDGAAGPALTATDDERFTRIGRFLATTKLDELPQLLNVLKGQMSLVGPRPEDPDFVHLRREDFERILSVRPGITGLSQLAFVRESELLDPARRVDDYLERFLPQKIAIDQVYVARRTLLLDLKILAWTAAAVLLRKDVAVNRKTAALTIRTPRSGGRLGMAPAAR
jgi:lipopolysaccharide/colanic/teichoic acid biosynthesis glycosyltransferase